MRYIVKSVVCDYGVYERTDFNNKEELIVICNSKSNAELIADILNADLEHERYEVVKKSKVDKAIEEIKQEIIEFSGTGEETIQAYCDGLKDALNGFERNIGE